MGECNFSTSRKFNLIRHHERHHKRQSSFNSYVQKTALEQSPFQGGQTFTQERNQQPVYHNQVPLPSHMQNNSNMTSDLDINQELNNLKDDYESLIEQNKILIQENQHLKNYLKHYNIKH